MKKFKLTDNTITVRGKTLYQIESLCDFADVHIGDKGGYVEKEENLSQDGSAWVYGNAKVFENACISEDAFAYGNAEIFGNARIYGNAKISDDAIICGEAKVYDNAHIFDYATVCDNAVVCDDAAIYGDAVICDNAEVYGYAKIFKNAWVRDNAIVYENATIGGGITICDDAEVCGNAIVNSRDDILWVRGIGAPSATTTAFKEKDGKISVVSNGFWGTLPKFAKHVKKEYEDEKILKEYELLIEIIKVRFGIKNKNKG